MVSYSPSIATMTVSLAVFEIIKEWHDLEIVIRSCSRSLKMKMAQFDRPYATFFWSAIVKIALSCTIFELFDVK